MAINEDFPLEFPKFMKFEGEKPIDVELFFATGEIEFVEDDDPRATMIISIESKPFNYLLN